VFRRAVEETTGKGEPVTAQPRPPLQPTESSQTAHGARHP